jgi:uncharacterized membrane protein YesL
MNQKLICFKYKNIKINMSLVFVFSMIELFRQKIVRHKNESSLSSFYDYWKLDFYNINVNILFRSNRIRLIIITFKITI